MKVLVTGGGGFVGSYVIQRLLERGYEVRSFGRSEQPQLEALGVEVVCGDLANPDAVLGACAGMDAIFHVAAKAGVWGTGIVSFVRMWSARAMSLKPVAVIQSSAWCTPVPQASCLTVSRYLA